MEIYAMTQRVENLDFHHRRSFAAASPLAWDLDLRPPYQSSFLFSQSRMPPFPLFGTDILGTTTWSLSGTDCQ
jgi:hypothetical protein